MLWAREGFWFRLACWFFFHNGQRTFSGLRAAYRGRRKQLFSLERSPNDFAQREGEVLDEGGCGDDLFALSEFGLLVDVDDFEIDAAFEMLIAEFAEIGDGGHGCGRCR